MLAWPDRLLNTEDAASAPPFAPATEEVAPVTDSSSSLTEAPSGTTADRVICSAAVHVSPSAAAEGTVPADATTASVPPVAPAPAGP